MENNNALLRQNIRKSPSWLIVKRLFLIKAPYFEMVDEREVRKFGTFSTGDRGADSKIAQGEKMGWRSIGQMLEIWERGSWIEIVHYRTDLPKMNTIIQAYFNEYEIYQAAVTGGGLGTHDKAQYQKLSKFVVKLDEFARFIFNRASGFTPRDIPKFNSARDILETPFIDAINAPNGKRTTADYVPIGERINYGKLGGRNKY